MSQLIIRLRFKVLTRLTEPTLPSNFDTVSVINKRSFFRYFSECAATEQLERQVLRARFFEFNFDFYQQSDAGIKPGTAGREAQTLPLCYAVPPLTRDLCHWPDISMLSKPPNILSQAKQFSAQGQGDGKYGELLSAQRPRPGCFSSENCAGGPEKIQRRAKRFPNCVSGNFSPSRKNTEMTHLEILSGWSSCLSTLEELTGFESKLRNRHFSLLGRAGMGSGFLSFGFLRSFYSRLGRVKSLENMASELLKHKVNNIKIEI